MSPEQAEAKKRSMLKRYLMLSGVNFDSNWPTHVLRALVKGLHMDVIKHGRPSYAWPLTGEQVEKVAKENHYLNQLVCWKGIWGLQASIGCVVGPGCETVQCNTVADLVRLGWVPKKYMYLDLHMHKLNVLYKKTA